MNFMNDVVETADKRSYLKGDPNHRLFEKLWDLLKDGAQPICLSGKSAREWGKDEAQTMDREFHPYERRNATIK